MSRTNAMTSVTARSIADNVTELLLQPRRIYLKHRKPRTPYVHALRRKMAAFLIKPVEMLWAISCADLEDGIPLSMVIRPYETIIALLAERAGVSVPTRPMTPLLPLVQREARAQGALQQAENEVLVNPESCEAIDRVLDAAAAHEAEEDRLVAAIRSRRAQLSLSGASV